MTAVIYPAIQCDGPGDGGEDGCYAETHHPMARTVTEVRRLRRDLGWRTRPAGRDICPDCWKAGHR